MHLFHNRLLAAVCCLFVAGAVLISLIDSFGAQTVLTLTALLFVACAVATLFCKRKLLYATLLCLFGLLLGSVHSALFFHVSLPQIQSAVDQVCVIEGTVIKRRQTEAYASSFDVELEAMNGVRCRTRATLECEYASALQPGDKFTATAVGRGFREENGYDEYTHSIADGKTIAFVCSSFQDCRIKPEKDRSWRFLFSEWNGELCYRLSRDVGGESGDLAGALLFGTRDSLDGSTELDFERTGVTHLLALSGSHIALLVAWADCLLRCVRCKKFIRVIAISIISIFYLFLTGNDPSTARAVIMFCTLAIGFCVRAEYDAFTSLTVSLALLILISPYAVFDLGMWMSFVAAGSIVIFLPALQNWLTRIHDKKILPKIVFRCLLVASTALFVGVVANLAMTAIQAFAFHQLPLLSVPHTILLSLPMTGTLFFGALTLLCPIFTLPCRLCAYTMLSMTEQAAELSYILVPLNDSLSVCLVILLTASLILLAVAKLKSMKWCWLPVGLCLLIICNGMFLAYFPRESVQVTYLRESGGDFLLFTSGGESVVIDFSDGTAGDAATLARAAETARCTELDDLIISHYHNKSAAFVRALSEQIKVRTLRLPTPVNEEERLMARRMEEEGKRCGLQVRYDHSELALRNLKIYISDRAHFDSGRHTALFYWISVNGEFITYLNASVPDSELNEAARLRINQSKLLIMGDTGFSSSSDTALPYFQNAPEEILLTDRKLSKLLYAIPHETTVSICPDMCSWRFD